MPITVLRIEDRYGNTLYEFQPQRKKVLDDRTAALMVEMLKNVVNHGTGVRLRYKYQIPGEIGGKTGTTQEHADGWFIGFTPQLTVGVWVGWEFPEIHFRSLKYGQGASMALPIWALLFKKLYADKSVPYRPEARFEFVKPEWIADQHCLYQWQSLKKTREKQQSQAGAEEVIPF